MDREIISEVWQAVSVLSDAQDLLHETQAATRESRQRLGQANGRINHAKRHLIRALELAKEQDPESFLQGVSHLVPCAIGEEENGETGDP